MYVRMYVCIKFGRAYVIGMRIAIPDPSGKMCMYVCMYACMYACENVGKYACMYVCIYACMQHVYVIGMRIAIPDPS